MTPDYFSANVTFEKNLFFILLHIIELVIGESKETY